MKGTGLHTHINQMLEAAQQLTLREIDTRLDEIEQERLVLLAARSFVKTVSDEKRLEAPAVPFTPAEKNRQHEKLRPGTRNEQRREDLIAALKSICDTDGCFTWLKLAQQLNVSQMTAHNRKHEFSPWFEKVDTKRARLSPLGVRIVYGDRDQQPIVVS